MGALAVDIEWVFWVAVGLAAAIAGARWAVPRLGDIITQIRNYPALLRRSADLQQLLNQVQADNQHLAAEAAKRYEDGLEEGRMEFLGAVLGSAVARPPEIVAIAGQTDVLLVGRWEPNSRVVPGARFLVEVASTGEIRGVVQVDRVEREGNLVYLRCVQRTVPGFWEALERRMQADATPPSDVRLSPFTPPAPKGFNVDEAESLLTDSKEEPDGR